jgi:hypothetical protein
MPMCAHGKKLYDEWREHGRILGVLDARRSVSMMANVGSDVPFDLDYEETAQKGIAAQQAFLGHEGFCSDCSNSWGHPAGYKFKPTE